MRCGSFKSSSDKTRISFEAVAENNMVCLLNDSNLAPISRISLMKPMSSIRSHSSRTKCSTAFRLT